MAIYLNHEDVPELHQDNFAPWLIYTIDRKKNEIKAQIDKLNNDLLNCAPEGSQSIENQIRGFKENGKKLSDASLYDALNCNRQNFHRFRNNSMTNNTIIDFSARFRERFKLLTESEAPKEIRELAEIIGKIPSKIEMNLELATNNLMFTKNTDTGEDIPVLLCTTENDFLDKIKEAEFLEYISYFNENSHNKLSSMGLKKYNYMIEYFYIFNNLSNCELALLDKFDLLDPVDKAEYILPVTSALVKNNQQLNDNKSKIYKNMSFYLPDEIAMKYDNDSDAGFDLLLKIIYSELPHISALDKLKRFDKYLERYASMNSGHWIILLAYSLANNKASFMKVLCALTDREL